MFLSRDDEPSPPLRRDKSTRFAQRFRSAIKYVGLKRKTKIHISLRSASTGRGITRERKGARKEEEAEEEENGERGGLVSSEEHCKLSPVLMATYMPVPFRVGLARIPSVICSHSTKLRPSPPRSIPSPGALHLHSISGH